MLDYIRIRASNIYVYPGRGKTCVYKTLINSYVRSWASRSSPIARGGRQRETTSTFALPMSTMTRQQCQCHHGPALGQRTHHHHHHYHNVLTLKEPLG